MGGFASLCLYALGLFIVLGIVWYVLLPDASGTDAWVFVRARMVRDAATEVLPFPTLAFALTIVDVTTELLAQIAYIALGLAILSVRTPRTSDAASLTKVAVIGLAMAAVAGGLFLALQRHGHRMTGKLAARLLRGAGTATAAMAASLDAYRSLARVGVSTTLHLAGCLLLRPERLRDAHIERPEESLNDSPDRIREVR